MSTLQNRFNSFNVYAIKLNINDNLDTYNYFINECCQQSSNNLIINYNDNQRSINIIFNEIDEDFLFYIFKEDLSLYTTYEDMNPYSIIYSQTDTEKEEFIDFLNYMNILDEPYYYNYCYIN